jgi:hypothetical protein
LGTPWQESTPLGLIDAIWELSLQVGVTVDIELSLQVAVAVYVLVPYSLTDDGPFMERLVTEAALPPPPSPPPPPHVRAVIARNTTINEAGRYALMNFLISITFLTSPMERGEIIAANPHWANPRGEMNMNDY